MLDESTRPDPLTEEGAAFPAAAAIQAWTKARAAFDDAPQNITLWTAATEALEKAAPHVTPPAPPPLDAGEVEAQRQALADAQPLDGALPDYDAEPVGKRDWLVQDYLPAARVTLFTGAGGAGKSRLALQLAAALAADGAIEWLPGLTNDKGTLVKAIGNRDDIGRAIPAPVVFGSYEDEPIEAARRLMYMYNEGRGLKFCAYAAHAGRLRYVDLAGLGPLWGPPQGVHVSTRAAMLPTGQKLLAYAEHVGARLLVLDPSAAAFGGNENDRGAVREFMAALDAWGREHGCAVLLIAHPPKKDADYSGSTDWRNAARTVWLLKPCATEGCGHADTPAMAAAGKAKNAGATKVNRPIGCGRPTLTVDKASYAPWPPGQHLAANFEDGGGAWQVEGGPPSDEDLGL